VSVEKYSFHQNGKLYSYFLAHQIYTLSDLYPRLFWRQPTRQPLTARSSESQPFPLFLFCEVTADMNVSECILSLMHLKAGLTSTGTIADFHWIQRHSLGRLMNMSGKRPSRPNLKAGKDDDDDDGGDGDGDIKT